MRRLLKPLVFIGCCAPLLKLAVDLVLGNLAEPVALSLNRLGFWTLTLLCMTLACTPAKQLLGWTAPNKVRRMLGLFAFFYASLHFLTYAVVDQELDWGDIWADISKRKFITVGVSAFLLLIPLAATSTQRMVKRLGFGRWKRLHRLVYVATFLGMVHFTWRVKADRWVPSVFAVLLVGLLAVRLWALRHKPARSAPVT